jgi:FkbM family methyltransferase
MVKLLSIRINRFLGSIGLIKNYFQFLYLKLSGTLFSTRQSSQMLLVKLRNGLKYFVRPRTNDSGILLEFWLESPYTPEGMMIRSDDVVVDIGANIGVFSIFASQRAMDGKVYAFEPMPDNFSVLQKNVEVNARENVVCLQKAIDKCTGERKFYVSDDTAWHSFYSSYLPNIKSDIVVPTITLDDVIREFAIKKIDFLKIDCEGAEYDILFNCSESVFDLVDKISMECHPITDNHNRDEIKAFLESKNYSVYTRGSLMLYAYKK